MTLDFMQYLPLPNQQCHARSNLVPGSKPPKKEKNNNVADKETWVSALKPRKSVTLLKTSYNPTRGFHCQFNLSTLLHFRELEEQESNSTTSDKRKHARSSSSRENTRTSSHWHSGGRATRTRRVGRGGSGAWPGSGAAIGRTRASTTTSARARARARVTARTGA